MAKITLLGHPLHAVISDWPVGLTSTSFAMDLLYLATKNQSFATTANHMLTAGVSTSVVVAGAGIAEYSDLKRKPQVIHTARIHAMLNTVVLGLSSYSLFLRKKQSKGIPPIAIGISAVANALLMLSAWYGGELVYQQGTRVRGGNARFDKTDIRIPPSDRLTNALKATTYPTGYVHPQERYDRETY